MSAAKGHGAKLPRKAEQAIAALLSCPTIEQAATTIGVDEATLRRWMKDPEFRTEYREARRQITEYATAQLQRLGSAAAKTLGEIIKDGDAPAAARVTACRAALDLALRGVEVEELTRRIENLERAAEAKSVSPTRASER